MTRTTAAHDHDEPFVWRREVLPEDHPHVQQIVSSTGFFSPAEVAIAVELVEEYLQRGERSGYCFLFAQQAGWTVGYACYGPIPCTLHSFDLYWIAVDRQSQRQGLGHRLMAEVESLVRRAGGSQLYIDTSGRAQYAPTRAFYASCGFQCAAVLKDFYAEGDDKLIYSKRLD